MHAEHAADVLLRHGVPVQALRRADSERTKNRAEPDRRGRRRGLEQLVEVGIEVCGAAEPWHGRDRALPEDPELVEHLQETGLERVGGVGLEPPGNHRQDAIRLARDPHRGERPTGQQVPAHVLAHRPGVREHRPQDVAEECAEGALPQDVGEQVRRLLGPTIGSRHRGERVSRADRQAEAAEEPVQGGPGERRRPTAALRGRGPRPAPRCWGRVAGGWPR